MKIQFYTNGKEYLGAIEHTKALDIKSHFTICSEYGIKTNSSKASLMLMGEYWQFKEDLKEKGFEPISLDTIVSEVFPQGYTYPTFTKFLVRVLGYEGFISFLVNSISTNESNPEHQAQKEINRLYYVLQKKKTLKTR